MTKRQRIWHLVARLAWMVTAALAVAGWAAAAEITILGNAKIWTVDKSMPWAEAVAFDQTGTIVGVGDTADLQAKFSAARYTDLRGRMVMPGFQDAHLHAVEAGLNAAACYVRPASGIRSIIGVMKRCKPIGDQGWLIGAGLNMFTLLDKDPNPIAALDKAFPNTPVLVLDDLGHGALANSAAFAKAGYAGVANDPQGGIILRNSAGQPNGVVLENAQQPFRSAAFPPTKANQAIAYRSLLDALDILARNGITSVSDAGGFWKQAQIRAWAQAEHAGKLTVRASNALYVYPDLPFSSQIAAIRSRYSSRRGALVRTDQAKIYVDGILSQGTAALFSPYGPLMGLAPDEELGFEYFQKQTLFRYARTLAAAGFQLHFHATGDRGVSLALDAIAQSSRASGPHRITHLYLVSKRDRARFKALGVVADFQMAPASLSRWYVNDMREVIGSRANDMLPAHAIAKTGALMTISSDWDADELSPLKKLQTLLTRGNRSIANLETAIEMLTINPARLLRHADTTGSIEVGKFADLVVLDRNLFEVPVRSIGRVSVRATLLQGEAVYDPARLFRN